MLREMIGFAAERLMALETEALCGVAPATAAPSGSRNVMGVATRIGIPVPELSSCAYPSCGTALLSWLPRAAPDVAGASPLCPLGRADEHPRPDPSAAAAVLDEYHRDTREIVGRLRPLGSRWARTCALPTQAVVMFSRADVDSSN